MQWPVGDKLHRNVSYQAHVKCLRPVRGRAVRIGFLMGKGKRDCLPGANKATHS